MDLLHLLCRRPLDSSARVFDCPREPAGCCELSPSAGAEIGFAAGITEPSRTWVRWPAAGTAKRNPVLAIAGACSVCPFPTPATVSGLFRFGEWAS